MVSRGGQVTISGMVSDDGGRTVPDPHMFDWVPLLNLSARDRSASRGHQRTDINVRFVNNRVDGSINHVNESVDNER